MEKEHAHHVHHEHKGIKMKKTDMLKSVVAILAILLIASILTKGFRFGGETVVPANIAAQKAVTYINNNVLAEGTTATLEGVEEEGNLYKVTLNVNGQEFDSYLTKDGSLLFPSSIEIEEGATASEKLDAPAPTGIEKSDKPEVELFVMSHCPYGTQSEKGIIPVVKLLGDNIEFSLRFVNYAMHGETEIKEQLNQYCIRNEQTSKLIPYLECFLGEGDGEFCLIETGIDTAKLETCTEAADIEFDITKNFEDKAGWLSGRYPKFMTDDALNTEYGVRGSPTLVINGKQASSGRDPASYLKTICAAFNEVPEECEEALSSAAPSPGFGYEVTGAATAATCG